MILSTGHDFKLEILFDLGVIGHDLRQGMIAYGMIYVKV